VAHDAHDHDGLEERIRAQNGEEDVIVVRVGPGAPDEEGISGDDAEDEGVFLEAEEGFRHAVKLGFRVPTELSGFLHYC